MGCFASFVGPAAPKIGHLGLQASMATCTGTMLTHQRHAGCLLVPVLVLLGTHFWYLGRDTKRQQRNQKGQQWIRATPEWAKYSCVLVALSVQLFRLKQADQGLGPQLSAWLVFVQQAGDCLLEFSADGFT